MVDEISDEYGAGWYGDYRINFMHPHEPARQFHWPLRKDPCWIPKDDILCCLETPSLTSSSSRNYCINQNDIVGFHEPAKSGPLTMNRLECLINVVPVRMFIFRKIPPYMGLTGPIWHYTFIKFFSSLNVCVCIYWPDNFLEKQPIHPI